MVRACQVIVTLLLLQAHANAQVNNEKEGFIWPLQTKENYNNDVEFLNTRDDLLKRITNMHCSREEKRNLKSVTNKIINDLSQAVDAKKFLKTDDLYRDSYQTERFNDLHFMKSRTTCIEHSENVDLSKYDVIPKTIRNTFCVNSDNPLAAVCPAHYGIYICRQKTVRDSIFLRVGKSCYHEIIYERADGCHCALIPR